MLYEISEETINNLFVFLDRVEIKGLKEVQAFNRIMDSLNEPVNKAAKEDEK